MEKEKIIFTMPGLFFNFYTINSPDEFFSSFHSHSAIEILKAIRGNVRFTIGNEEVCVSEGELILINRNIAHEVYSKNVVFSYIQVDILPYMENRDSKEFPYWWDFVLGKSSNAYYKFAEESEMGDLWNRIEDKFHNANENKKHFIKAYIYELVAIMFSHSLVSAVPMVSSPKMKIISPVIKYIDTHFNSNITLDDICREVGYNKYTICHSFKKIAGTTVFEYVGFVRIQSAVEKLKNKEYTILEIATQSGFSSVTYFNRVFKNVMGCTPSLYRKHFL